MSINTNIVKSAKAIAPIVMFTVNAPPILNTLFNKVPFLKSTNSEFRIALLAIIKHLWIWGPENKLNDISTGQPSQTIQPLKEIIVRRTAHTAREGILISLISKNHCDTQLEKFKSIFIMAIMQTVFDRLSFKTNLNVLFTVMSRFLYLLLVKEVIE